MNKNTRNLIGGTLVAGAVIATLVMTAVSGGINKTFSPNTPNGIWLQAANPPVEHYVSNGSYWTLYVGSPASNVTHFMRARFGVPETLGVPSLTRFCISSRIRLPFDFFDKWNDGRVGGGTDNYLGASGGNELRASIYVTADGRVRVRAEHQNHQNIDYYVSDPRPGYLEPGIWHDLVFCGNVAAVEGWYFMVDGVVIAQGVAMLAPATVPVAERIVTRGYCGPDGAYRLVLATPLAIDLAWCNIKDYDPNGILAPAPATSTAGPTASSLPPTVTRTATVQAPTATATRTAIPIPSVTGSPSAIPTVCLPQFKICVGPQP